MNWPTMSDYQEAIQNPALCFSDPQLKAGTPTVNALGLPQPVTGGFCSVYQVTSAKTRWAVRCFLYNIKDLRDRYHQISKYLRWSRPKQMVGFEYVPEGIRVRGEMHPVLKMEWVEGDQLNVWVDKHHNDKGALRKLDDQWADVMDNLERAKIGHCDLQHGNVLVTSGGHLRLIDYDGMYVPPLRGRGSHEKGHPAYQHPEREGRDFDDRVDRFAALVVHVSLIALAEEPGLWKRYYDEDNLLFKRADFQSPDSSPVFQELLQMGGTVGDTAAVLREACKRRVDQSPRLRDVRQGKAKAAPGKLAQIIPLPVAPRAKAQPSKSRKAKSAKASSASAAASGTAGRSNTLSASGTLGASSSVGGAKTPLAGSQSSQSSSAPAASATPVNSGPAAMSAAAAQPAPAPVPAPRKMAQAAPAPVPVQKAAPAKAAKAAAKAAAQAKASQAKPAQAPVFKPTGTQPAWMVSAPAPAPAPAPTSPPSPKPVAPAASAAPARPAPASAPPKLPPNPPAAATPRPASAPAAALARAGSQPALSARSTPPGGWIVEWVRPGELNEQHVRRTPIWGTREVPRTFLGITFGTRKEKYAESYDETVEDRGYPLGGHRSAITSLAFTSDGRFLASASRDGTVRVWNVQSGREAYSPLEARSGVVAMALVPDRPMLVAALEDRRLLIWDYGLHRKIVHIEAPDRSPLQAVAVSHDGRWVAAGGARRRIYLWQTDGGAAVGELEYTTGRVEALAFTPDASGIACATHKGRLEVLERDSGQERWSIRTGLGRLRTIIASPRPGGVLGGAAEGTVARWDWNDGSELHRVRPSSERLSSLALSPDGAQLLVGSGSGKAYLSDMSSNRELALLDGHPGAVTATALPSTGRHAATGATDGTVRLWGVA